MHFCEFDLQVTPRSSQRRVDLLDDGSLKVWVTQAPTDGQANQGVREALSEALGVPKSRIDILRGLTSRKKRIRIDGVGLEEALVSLRNGPQGTRSPKRPDR